MCEGASKQTPDLKILPHRDRAPPFWNSWIRLWHMHMDKTWFLSCYVGIPADGLQSILPTSLWHDPHLTLIRPCIMLLLIISPQTVFVDRCPIFNIVANKLDTSECTKSKCPPYSYRSNEIDVGKLWTSVSKVQWLTFDEVNIMIYQHWRSDFHWGKNWNSCS